MALNPRHLTDAQLQRALISARNRRDAFAAGREPEEVLREVNALLREQRDRARARLTGRRPR